MDSTHFASLERVKIVDEPLTSVATLQLWTQPSPPSLKALDVQCGTTNTLATSSIWLRSSASSLEWLRLRVGRHVLVKTILDTLHDLTGHLPKLEVLELSAELEDLRPGQRHDLAHAVRSLCSKLPALRVLRLQLDIVQYDTVDPKTRRIEPYLELSDLHRLEELFLFSGTSITSKTVPDAPRSPIIKLPVSVRILNIDAPPSRCIDFFHHLLASVTDLHLRVSALCEQSELCSVLDASMNAIPFTGPLLPASKLRHSSVARMFLTIDDTHLPPLSLATLKEPLDRAPDMQSFSIQCGCPISYTRQDMGERIYAWHFLQHLSLNPRPSRWADRDAVYSASDGAEHAILPLPGTPQVVLPSLDVLIPVTQKAPHLKTLGLLLNCSPLPVVEVRNWAPTVSQLDLGFSVGPTEGASDDAAEVWQYIESLLGKVVLTTGNVSPWVERVAAAARDAGASDSDGVVDSDVRASGHSEGGGDVGLSGHEQCE